MMQTEVIAPVHQLSQSINGQRTKNKTLERFYNVIIGLLSTAITGLFIFIWDVNSTLAVMKERDDAKTQKIDEMMNKINNIQLTVQEIKEDNIRLKVKLNP